MTLEVQTYPFWARPVWRDMEMIEGIVINIHTGGQEVGKDGNEGGSKEGGLEFWADMATGVR